MFYKKGFAGNRTRATCTRSKYFATELQSLDTYLSLSLFSLFFFFNFFLKKRKGTIGFEPMTTGTAVLCSTTELCALLITTITFS